MHADIKPFLKWAGGKRQLLPEIKDKMPLSYCTYYEPFVGAGAILFGLMPEEAVVNDANEELIGCYLAIKEDVEKLIELLYIHKNNHQKDPKEYYYFVRNVDRNVDDYAALSSTEKAARFIYLNKTCFNGLHRVNSKGQNNVPFGGARSPGIFDESHLREISSYLNASKVVFSRGDFEACALRAKKGDFVYFDPPYDPVNATSSFASYTKGGFGKEEQERLRELFVVLHNKGCKLMLSNSSTEYIKEMYRDFNIHIVQASRSINSKGDKRGKVDEVIVTNY